MYRDIMNGRYGSINKSIVSMTLYLRYIKYCVWMTIIFLQIAKLYFILSKNVFYLVFEMIFNSIWHRKLLLMEIVHVIKIKQSHLNPS